jgi:hypothetical protein
MPVNYTNPMSVPELAYMYNVSTCTIRSLVSRSVFAKFDLGRLRIKRGNRIKTAVYYDCTEEFNTLIKEALSSIRARYKRPC